MPDRVFYSWQSDLPGAANRSFIEHALEAAVGTLRTDESLSVDLVLDRDTAGVPGAPDIASTIFGKIDDAVAFVADVSIITPPNTERPSPNPNVLIELGYAKKSLGPDRVLMVMNTAFGGPELLPFDLRMRRVLTYSSPAEAAERSTERRRLESLLTTGLQAILNGRSAAALGDVIAPPSLNTQFLSAVDASRPDQASIARRYMTGLVERLDAIAPDLRDPQLAPERIVTGLEASVPLVAEFVGVADRLAAMNAKESALAVYDTFDSLLIRCDTAPGFSGAFYDFSFDFYKFLSHELLVCLVAPLVREQRWEILEDLLATEIYLAKASPNGNAGVVPFTHASQYLKLLDLRNERLQLRRVSLHSDLLLARHTEGPLAAVCPHEQFLDGDIFLFLRGEVVHPAESPWPAWKPWSVLHMKRHVPRFLAQSTTRRFAERIRGALGAPDVETLRARLSSRLHSAALIFSQAAGFSPFSGFSPDQIGTR